MNFVLVVSPESGCALQREHTNCQSQVKLSTLQSETVGRLAFCRRLSKPFSMRANRDNEGEEDNTNDNHRDSIEMMIGFSSVGTI